MSINSKLDNFTKIVQWCNKDPRCNKLQLTDLLVSPVHHIMKVFTKETFYAATNIFSKRSHSC